MLEAGMAAVLTAGMRTALQSTIMNMLATISVASASSGCPFYTGIRHSEVVSAVLCACAGKRFYHQASTEALGKLQRGDTEGHKRMEHVLGKMLEAFIQKGQDEYMLRHQQEQQRVSSRAQAEVCFSPCAATLPPPDAAAAAASVAASVTTQGLVITASSGAAAALNAAGLQAASTMNDVLKQLVEAELFHTEWKSQRPLGEASPAYNGDLVEELVRGITGLTMTMRPADSS